MRIVLFLFSFIILISCKHKEPALSADEIIGRTIINACNGNCENAVIRFIFRGRAYVSSRAEGKYQLERVTTDSMGVTRDVLTNNGFERFRNDTLVFLPDSMKVKYANSVNGVHYFAQLPYGLDAPAARKERIGETTIKGLPYYLIEVTFEQEGGGKDYEDVFVYWIHQNNFTVDYFAYSYKTDGGGMRFREALNPRIVEGIRFADYNNYKPKDLDVPLPELARLYEEGALELLSKIETEDVLVTLGEAPRF